jgi:hypothetical protein
LWDKLREDRREAAGEICGISRAFAAQSLRRWYRVKREMLDADGELR